MSDRPLDPERLKELIGEIDPLVDEVEVVHEIGASGKNAKSMEEIAAAAVAEIEKNTGPRRKYSTDERPELAPRRRWSSVLLAALVMTFSGVVGYRFFRPPSPVLPSDPIAFIGVLSAAAAAKPTVEPEWSVPRGASDSLSERGMAIRIGALLVEYERAAARGDSTAQVFGDAISALVTNVPDGIDVATIFAAGGADARSSTARHALAPLVRVAPMALGGWLQAARVAASAGDAGFFVSRESRAGLTQLLALRSPSPEVEAARDRLDTLLHRRGRPDFAAVADALETIQRELAN